MSAVLVVMLLAFAHTVTWSFGIEYTRVTLYLIAALAAATLLDLGWTFVTALLGVASYALVGQHQLSNQQLSSQSLRYVLGFNAIGLLVGIGVGVAFHRIYAHWMDTTLARERRLGERLKHAYGPWSAASINARVSWPLARSAIDS